MENKKLNIDIGTDVADVGLQNFYVVDKNYKDNQCNYIVTSIYVDSTNLSNGDWYRENLAKCVDYIVNEKVKELIGDFDKRIKNIENRKETYSDDPDQVQAFDNQLKHMEFMKLYFRKHINGITK